MNWDNDKCLELIGLYEKKEELWQPDHKYHYNKLRKNDAWEEIATTIGVPSGQVKGKINSLLASYRRELMKEQKSKGPGKGLDEVYKSKWYAFEALRFLKAKKKCKETQSSSLFSQNSVEERNSLVEDLEGSATSDNSNIEDEYFMTAHDVQYSEEVLTSQQGSNVTSPASISKDEHFLQPPLSYKRQKKSLSTADRVGGILERSIDRRASDVYGEHVALKLKTYNRKTQAVVQHYINNILFQADMGSLQVPVQHQPMLEIYSTPPSPQHCNLQQKNSQHCTLLHSPCSSSSSNNKQ